MQMNRDQRLALSKITITFACSTHSQRERCRLTHRSGTLFIAVKSNIRTQLNGFRRMDEWLGGYEEGSIRIAVIVLVRADDCILFESS